METTADLLQIKIEKAKGELPIETQNAINAVDWKAVILSLRATRGYTFEQLGDLELETELVLCGLLSPRDYPNELSKRMEISKAAADELVNEMGNLVFKKIREELIKNIERKKIFQKSSENQTTQVTNDTSIFNGAGIEIIDRKEVLKEEKKESIQETLPVPERLEIVEAPRENVAQQVPEIKKVEMATILAQKMADSFKSPRVQTEYSLNNISKSKSETETSTPEPKPTTYPPKGDPYRLSPDE